MGARFWPVFLSLTPTEEDCRALLLRECPFPSRAPKLYRHDRFVKFAQLGNVASAFFNSPAFAWRLKMVSREEGRDELNTVHGAELFNWHLKVSSYFVMVSILYNSMRFCFILKACF